jgi:hypothetical protein
MPVRPGMQVPGSAGIPCAEQRHDLLVQGAAVSSSLRLQLFPQLSYIQKTFQSPALLLPYTPRRTQPCHTPQFYTCICLYTSAPTPTHFFSIPHTLCQHSPMPSLLNRVTQQRNRPQVNKHNNITATTPLSLHSIKPVTTHLMLTLIPTRPFTATAACTAAGNAGSASQLC